MNKNYLRFSLTICIFVFSSSFLFSQNLWKKADYLSKTNDLKLERKSMPKKAFVFDLKMAKFKSQFLQKNSSASKFKTRISFPNEKGKIEQYEVHESYSLSKELQKKYPKIKSYTGKKVGGNTIVKFSVSPYGVNAMFLNEGKKTTFLDPYTKDGKSYLIYSKSSLPNLKEFTCKVEGHSIVENSHLQHRDFDTNDGVLRVFRLAVAATAEYSQFHLTRKGIAATATEAVKKEAVLAAINTTITRVNAIYERDVALTMQLVANNDKIIFFDAEKDGLTNDKPDDLISESQTVIDNNIGFNNYDIGHTFSTEGGGLAQLKSVCTQLKARGITGTTQPIGDAYDVDFVTHEIGHQFGATHTFNSTSGNCSGANKNETTAVEPGSGSTIMAYAGLCAPQNLQSNSDPYFHLVSIQQIRANITSGYATCATQIVTNNKPPVISSLSNYIIPTGTPFCLDAVATDENNDNLTYTWEQLDRELGTFPLDSSAAQGPMFRSVKPSTSSKRFFPNLDAILSGKLKDTKKFEVLPFVEREMKFAVNVRDNNSSGGQTASAETTVTFSGNAGPFKITSQNNATTWKSSSIQQITWNVANTNQAPINTQKVTILFSSDGGQTFTQTLASNVPNTGSYKIAAPITPTTKGRIKIQAANNIYFDINDAAITVESSNFDFVFTERNKEICSPNSVTYSFNYQPNNSFSEEVTFSTLSIPQGTMASFSPQKITSAGTVQLTLSNITTTNIGKHFIEIKATSSLKTNTSVAYLKVNSNVIDAPTLVSPTNNSLGIYPFTPFVWNETKNTDSYTVDFSTDANFKTIEISKTVESTTINISTLQPNTTYYWRVKSINFCGESSYSKVRSFKTVPKACETLSSGSINKSIPDNTTTGIKRTLKANKNVYIDAIEVTVNISHNYVGDVTLKLINPQGKEILLAANLGGDGKGYTNTIFDDSAAKSIFTAVAPFTGTFKPQESIIQSELNQSKGNWQLKIVDSGAQDTGILESWSISFCGQLVNYLDSDGDGINDADDKCPNTPTGKQVNTEGCTVFTLPYNNFKLKYTDETCPNKGNGKLEISAEESYAYTAILNGVTKKFTSTTTFDNLTPKTYEVCISVENETYEQCFSFTINKGSNLLAKSSIANKKMKVEIQEGTPPFTISINGVKQFETQNKAFTVSIAHGDLVEVQAKSLCQGKFVEQVDLFKQLIAYPNPTTSTFKLLVPSNLAIVKTEVYNASSQLVKSKICKVINGKIEVDITSLPIGVYVVKVYLEKPVVVKVIKH